VKMGIWAVIAGAANANDACWRKNTSKRTNQESFFRLFERLGCSVSLFYALL
jgi:hypothetical protein